MSKFPALQRIRLDADAQLCIPKWCRFQIETTTISNLLELFDGGLEKCKANCKTYIFLCALCRLTPTVPFVETEPRESITELPAVMAARDSSGGVSGNSTLTAAGQYRYSTMQLPAVMDVRDSSGNIMLTAAGQ